MYGPSGDSYISSRSHFEAQLNIQSVECIVTDISIVRKGFMATLDEKSAADFTHVIFHQIYRVLFVDILDGNGHPLQNVIFPMAPSRAGAINQNIG